MILYFSATGNNKYVAQELAKQTEDTATAILDCIREDNYRIELRENEALGFVFPTYFYGLPSIVMEYLGKIRVNRADAYTYLIASYGTSPGSTNRFAQNAVTDPNIRFDAFYSIKMPDTWTPEFDLSNKEEVKMLNEAEPEQIRAAAQHIRNLRFSTVRRQRITASTVIRG